MAVQNWLRKGGIKENFGDQARNALRVQAFTRTGQGTGSF